MRAAAAALKSRRRHVALRGDPRRRVLLQLRVERHALAGVVDRAVQGVVVELAEAALADLKVALHVRRVLGAGDRARRVQRPGQCCGGRSSSASTLARSTLVSVTFSASPGRPNVPSAAIC